ALCSLHALRKWLKTRGQHADRADWEFVARKHSVPIRAQAKSPSVLLPRKRSRAQRADILLSTLGQFGQCSKGFLEADNSVSNEEGNRNTGRVSPDLASTITGREPPAESGM